MADARVCSGSRMQMHEWARVHVSMQLHKLVSQSTHVQRHRCADTRVGQNTCGGATCSCISGPMQQTFRGTSVQMGE